ncbi:MAG: glycosyltransferase family 39 protein [Deltaproteobacteria bacterium]|nr:glycosyltransferase family 39 protein [Deltaproteobacteria bacterium]
MSSSPLRAAWICVALLVALLAFRLGEPGWGAGATPSYLYDEAYTAFEAGRILRHDAVVFRPAARRFEYLASGANDLAPTSRGEWSHPPFAPLAVAGTSAIFGWSAFGARLAALLAAALTLAAVARLAGRRHAIAACLLLGLDGVFFVFGRTALPHVFVVAGVTTGVLATRMALVRPSRWLHAATLAGFAFGCATAARWTALPVALLVGLAVLGSREGRRLPRARFAGVLAASVVATYLATWAPAWASGMSPRAFVELHAQMAWFHTHLPSCSGASSPPYTWPWLRHPVIFTVRAQGDARTMVAAAGNPLLWWGLVPAVVALAIRARGRGARALVPLAAIVGVLLPWAFAERFGFFYYLLPALPFVAIALAELTARARRLRVVHLALAATFFVASYPVLAAVPLGPSAMELERALHGMPRGALAAGQASR